jgi:uncharacterized protein YqgC (DUF456 family)
MDIAIVIIGIVLIVLAAAGSVLPVLPGAPVAYGALFLLLLHSTASAEINSRDFVIYGVAVGIISLVDYYLPIWGTKKFGGTDAGKRGSFWGMILGLFVLTPLMGPLSILIGPLAGAYIGEMIAHNDNRMALKSAWGSFLGFLAGTLMKMVYCGVVLWKFISAVW